MSTTVRDSNLYKDVLVPAIAAAFAGRQALANSGVAQMVPNLPVVNGFVKAGTGTKIQVPYFSSLGNMEIVPEGGALTPRALTSTLEEATIVKAGIAGEITNWAQMVAQAGDPYKAIADQFATMGMRQMDQALIDAAKNTTLVYNNGAATINVDSFTNARALWGDEEDEIALAVVHSFVMQKLRLLKDSQLRPYFNEFEQLVDGKIIRRSSFMGVPLFVSDRLTPTGTVYPTLLCKKGALVCWFNGLGDIKEDVDILADTEVQAMHLYYAAHMYKQHNGGTKPGVVRLNTTET